MFSYRPCPRRSGRTHLSGWRRSGASGRLCTRAEIYEELSHLVGPIGECIKKNKDILQYEVEDTDWDWNAYLAHYERMKIQYEAVISDYNSNRKNTIGLKDLTIIALAKTLGLPVVSSEKKTNSEQDSKKRQKIPDICDKEGVQHMSFNDLLRAEGIKK